MPRNPRGKGTQNKGGAGQLLSALLDGGATIDLDPNFDPDSVGKTFGDVSPKVEIDPNTGQMLGVKPFVPSGRNLFGQSDQAASNANEQYFQNKLDAQQRLDNQQKLIDYNYNAGNKQNEFLEKKQTGDIANTIQSPFASDLNLGIKNQFTNLLEPDNNPDVLAKARVLLNSPMVSKLIADTSQNVASTEGSRNLTSANIGIRPRVQEAAQAEQGAKIAANNFEANSNNQKNTAITKDESIVPTALRLNEILSPQARINALNANAGSLQKIGDDLIFDRLKGNIYNTTPYKPAVGTPNMKGVYQPEQRASIRDSNGKPLFVLPGHTVDAIKAEQSGINSITGQPIIGQPMIGQPTINNPSRLGIRTVSPGDTIQFPSEMDNQFTSTDEKPISKKSITPALNLGITSPDKIFEDNTKNKFGIISSPTTKKNELESRIKEIQTKLDNASKGKGEPLSHETYDSYFQQLKDLNTQLLKYKK